MASERARANFQELDTYLNNMTIADRRIKLMVTSIEEITTHSENVADAIQIQTQQGDMDIKSVGDLARKSRDFIINLINEMDGDRYLFGGADTQTKPVTDTGLQGSYMQFHIDQWINSTAGYDTDDLIASYRDRTALNDSINGYSASLAAGTVTDVHVRVGKNDEMDYTLLASHEGFRDIITALGMLDNLSQTLDSVTAADADPSDGVIDPVGAPGATRQEKNENFYKVFNDIAVMITGGLDKLQTETFKLSQVQAKMAQITDDYKLEKNTLSSTIADVEDVDVNEVAVKLNTLELQLEASYRVTATVSQLSLAYFL